MWQTFTIFLQVVTPVFSLVLIGYLAGPRLKLEASTFSKAIYYIFLPAFIFDVISKAQVQLDLAMRMVSFCILLCVCCAAIGFGMARLLRRPPTIAAGYALIAVYGNVGNFGLSLTQFRWGEEAIIPATIYLLIINTAGLVIGVVLANLVRGGRLTAAFSVLKTPALIALVPAFAFQATNIQVPLFAARITGLLSDAAVPLLLVALGIQLAGVKKPQINRDVLVASALRLIGGPILATLLIIPFHLSGIERNTGIMQASMPAAVLTSIIAMEHDLEPEFVTTTVLFSTLASIVTLTILLSLL